MRLDIDPKEDVAFKKLFGNEDNALLLVSLLNAIVQPARPVTGVEIVLPTSDKSSPEDKMAIGDVKARDQGRRQFHLEMQRQTPTSFPKRAVWYWSKFHGQQLLEGENYLTLRPTITICIANRTLYPETEDHHLVFRLLDLEHGLLFSDDEEIHLIQLPKFNKTVDQLSDALDRWCYFLKHGADLDLEQLPASLDVPEIRRALEVLTVFTQEERERERYELLLKQRYDHNTLLLEAEERGLEKGLKEGAVGRIHLAQRLLKQALRPREELLALPLDELTRLAETLEQQLLSGSNGAS